MDSSGASLLVFFDSVLIVTSRTLENMDMGSLGVWSGREFLRSGALKWTDNADGIRIDLHRDRALKERDGEYEPTFPL